MRCHVLSRLGLVALGVVLVVQGMLALVAYPAPAFAQNDRVPPGGAPPPGGGPIDLGAFVRVVDGQSIDAVIRGSRVAIGVLGVEAPQGNTSCGREATERLKSLARDARARGGLRLVEDPSELLDARGRRLYYVEEKAGHPIADELVRAGVAKANGKGKDKDKLKQLEDEARRNGRGCVHRAPTGGLAPAEAAGDPLLAFRVDGAVDRGWALSLEEHAAAVRAAPAAAPAAVVPGGFVDEAVVGELTNPTALAFLPDGRILVAEKDGLVKVIKDGTVLATPLIDLRGRVNDYWDRGLLGIAAHPSFAQNGYLYLLYTYENDPARYDGPKTSRLTRVTVAGDAAAPSSEVVILGKTVGAGCPADSATDPIKVSSADCIPSDYFSHSIGSVRFAPDGALFVSTGDGANFNTVDDPALRSQRLDSLAGKLLRVDANGAGLSSNPFWNGNAGANRSKVWAYGLRNPYRFTLRPGTSVPYLGDVGWGAWEEVDVAPAGANLGWPCYEGAARQGGYEPKQTCQALYAQGGGAVRAPLAAWGHDGGGAAATGGAFYTGTAFPAEYRGAYFYADYALGFVRYLTVDAAHALVGGPADFGTASNPVAIEMGPDGNLYYVAVFAGELRRIRYGAATTPPPPDGTSYVSDLTWISATNGWGSVEKDMSNGETAAGDGVTISLNGKTYAKGLGVHAPSDVAYNLGGACTRFEAEVGVDDEVGANGSVVLQVFWGDGTKAFDSGTMTGASATKVVSVDATNRQTMRLVVTDAGDGNGYDHASWGGARLTCGGAGGNTPPRPTISAPASTLTYKVGDTIAFSGGATDDQDGSLAAARLDWEVILHHCPGGACHTHPLLAQDGVASGSFTAPDEADDNKIEIKLTATDSGGLTGTTSVTLLPQTVRVTIATSPTGLQVSYSGETGAAPLTRTAIVGSKRTIHAPSPQGSQTFQFWSKDGVRYDGAQQHDITIGASDATYTATFAAGPDTTPPTVTGTSPANGAKNVRLDATVAATFSEAMDPATLTTATVTLVRQGTTTPIAATVTYDAATKTATLDPAANLAASRTTYTATIKGGAGGAKDLAGNPLAADRTWTFSTVNR